MKRNIVKNIATCILMAGLVFIGAGCPVPPIPVATPSITPSSGTYPNAVTVSIKCSTTLSTCYYTTNGVAPSTQSMVYSTPFVLSNSATVQAIAVVPFLTNSAAGVADYTIVVVTNSPTPPNPPDPPTPPPTNGPVSTMRIGMFQDSTGSKYPAECNLKATSPMGFRYVHGKSYENDFRLDILDRMQATKCNTIPVLFDGMDVSNIVLDMCIHDRSHPEDGRHMVQDEGWYERCAAHGVLNQILVFRDSPDSRLSVSKASVQRTVDAFHGSRFKKTYLTGFETKRNNTIDQAAQTVLWFNELDPSVECWVGDQSMDFLLAVKAKLPNTHVRLWLEQPTHPTQDPLAVRFMNFFRRPVPIARHTHVLSQPLGSAQTTQVYLNEMARGAAVVGASNIVAGEWFANDKATRIRLTQQFESYGYICGGGGDWSAVANVLRNTK